MNSLQFSWNVLLIKYFYGTKLLIVKLKPKPQPNQNYFPPSCPVVPFVDGIEDGRIRRLHNSFDAKLWNTWKKSTYTQNRKLVFLLYSSFIPVIHLNFHYFFFCFSFVCFLFWIFLFGCCCWCFVCNNNNNNKKGI